MKHFKTLEKLKGLLPQISNLEIALLYGSYGRNQAKPNSDLDIKLIVNPNFEVQYFIDLISREFKSEVKFVKEISLRKKVVMYLSELPKVEFAICNDLKEINRDFIGSEITNVSNSILYENNKELYGIENYLTQLIENKNNSIVKHSNEKYINELTDKFIYEFESCSALHSRSDGYQFYFFYNIAMHAAVQLNYISKGKTAYSFLPKNYITDVLSSQEQSMFYNLKGSLFLPEANARKRVLLDYFYNSIEGIIPVEKYKEIKQFCEWVYERDYFWNFRDANVNNSKIKMGQIYRTSALALIKNTNQINNLLKEKNIKTIVDLRADREIEAVAYPQEILSSFKYVKAQFDPWNQPKWFKEKHQTGTNHEIAYRFFAMGCKDAVKKTFEAILEEELGAVAIHCHAGKDRTGIIFSMLHLLIDTPIDLVYADYLASEMDVSLDKLEIALEVIKDQGGIHDYLLSCKLTDEQISQLKQKILDE